LCLAELVDDEFIARLAGQARAHGLSSVSAGTYRSWPNVRWKRRWKASCTPIVGVRVNVHSQVQLNVHSAVEMDDERRDIRGFTRSRSDQRTSARITGTGRQLW
jgi:hypothetical protein